VSAEARAGRKPGSWQGIVNVSKRLLTRLPLDTAACASSRVAANLIDTEHLRAEQALEFGFEPMGR